MTTLRIVLWFVVFELTGFVLQVTPVTMYAIWAWLAAYLVLEDRGEMGT